MVEFPSESERRVFDDAVKQLTAEERQEMGVFFNGVQTATTTAKGVTGAAIAVWMAFASRKLQQKRVRVRPLYPLLAGVGLAVVVFQAVTPAIYDNEKTKLAQIASPNVVRVVESVEPIVARGANAHQVAKLFN